MNKINFVNKNCLELTKDIEDNSIDLIIIDPPYGVNFLNNKLYNDDKDFVKTESKKWLKEISRILKEGSHLYIFVPTLEVDLWVSNVKETEGLKFNNIIATQTHNTNRYLKNNFSFDLQLVLYISKGKAKRLNKVDYQKTSQSWLNDKRNTNPKEYSYKYSSFHKELKSNHKNNKFNKISHGNQKSVEFVKLLIELSSDENDTVLDCFTGSGTTAISSLLSNRNFIGCELNKDIFEKAEERIKNTIGNLDFLEELKQYYNLQNKKELNRFNKLKEKVFKEIKIF